MSTILNKTNGTVLTEIADGAADQTTTNLAFIGKLYRNYGELVNENFVKLLENFANNTSPSKPIIGQLWYDTQEQNVKIYKSSGFVALSNTTVSSAEPSSPVIGDFWYDTDDGQLKIYSGSAWIVIAPLHTIAQGKTGVFPETITDTTVIDRVVNKIYVSDVVVAIYSKDTEFTPQLAINGFSTIKTGLNFANFSGFKLHGIATDSELLNGFDGTEFLQFNTDQVTTGSFTIENTAPIILGTSNEFSINTTNTNTDLVRNSAGNIRLINSSGSTVFTATETGQTLHRDGTVGAPSISFINDTDTGISGATDNEIDIITGGAVRIKINNTQTEITGDVLPSSDSSFDLGAIGSQWSNVYAETLNGTAVEALYADLAEKYTTDIVHTTGTVMCVCNHPDHETCPADSDHIPVGVTSDSPAYLMNSAAPGQALALTGRVPVRVIGTVAKGDPIYAYQNGVASVNGGQHLVGIALESSSDSEEKLVECVLKL